MHHPSGGDIVPEDPQAGETEMPEKRSIPKTPQVLDRGRETLAQRETIDFHNAENARRRRGEHVPSVLDIKKVHAAKRKPPDAL